MTCPFLGEAQVKYCQTAAVRTLIPLAQAASAQEKCSSGAFTGCPIYQAHPQEGVAAGACPHLRESLMQYCSAAPVTKFIPYSESLLSRCGSDSHRYCELYVGMAHPSRGAIPADHIPVPEWLLYSDNHMWLDLTADGICHAGVDAFLSRAMGQIDAVTYVRLKGRQRPAAVITAQGLDFELVFPNYFAVSACNLYLRADPARLTRQPYAGGWLFEGKPEPGTADGLRRGAVAQEWMHEEQHRMNEHLQQLTGVAADGGTFASDLAAHLDRGQRLALFHEFFSPEASETRGV
jgi:glycine cleavage system H lipoate-binding protein